MALFVLSLCPFDISVGVGAFVIGLSQISSLFSLYESTLTLLFTDVGYPGHRLQGIILDISSNRLFKAVRVGEPT